MTMKKILGVCLALVLMAAVACAEVTFTAGTYEGTGEGYGESGVKATVVLNDEGVESITVDAPEGTRTFKFTTDGRTCSKNVVFDIVGEDQILKNVVYEGGCNGGTQGIGVMAEGRPAAEVADILEHIVCDLKKSGSSCGQQLAFGIKQAMMIINGTPCSGCSGTVCENMK